VLYFVYGVFVIYITFSDIYDKKIYILYLYIIFFSYIELKKKDSIFCHKCQKKKLNNNITLIIT
jgi:hypothetical protein